ncbi:MAG: mechanosensitive ion channel family protein [bacterium]|nr:mechanosensitive ion channel family protein [bacterium]MDN5835451.1 mechanosensitive ion channel family protein [bacterium]
MEALKSLIPDFILSPLIVLVIGIVLYYLGGLVISALIRHVVNVRGRTEKWRKDDVSKRQRTLSGLSAGIWKILVFVVVVLTIVKIIYPAISFAPIFASAGILGLALGFGAQSIVKDFISGLFIVIENQFRVGDIIDQAGVYGTVVRIGARSTVLRDFSGNLHYFPNGLIDHTVNLTSGYSNARFDVRVSPDNDLDFVIKTIADVGLKLSKKEDFKSIIATPPVVTYISDVDALAAVLTVSGETQPAEQWTVVTEMRKELLARFKKEGIKLAYPVPPGLLSK